MPEQVTQLSEDIGRLVGRLVEAWNSHDPDRVARLYASSYEGVDVGEASPQRGPEGIRQSAVRYLRAFPDLQLSEEEQIVEGNRVALAWKARGTHRGALLNIPATGRLVEIRGVSLLALDGGKIARGLYVWDVAGLLRDLGLLTEL